ncbi:MAG: hypothetical protein R3B64_02335 [Candidatus Paceibacterota bacterium]|nr:hypothetical protein [Candidatus Nomurabacteria bacterium]
MNIIKFIFTDLIYIWLPILLFYMMYFLWEQYIEDKFVSGIEWKLLEIKIPRDIDKSPLAMEMFIINALYHESSKGWWEKRIQGAVRFFFSLEIISESGKIRYFVRTPSRVVPLVTSQLYAQYPQAEIKEVPDYTRKFSRIKDNSRYDMWGCEFTKENNEVFPLKTYVDYGLDKLDLKDEYKIDPLNSTLEFLASVRKGENIWIQYNIRASAKKYHRGGLFSKPHSYFEEIEYILEDMLKKYTQIKRDPETGAFLSQETRTPDTTLRDKIEALRKAAKKLPFDVNIRTMYIAEREVFDPNTRRALRLMFRQFAQPTINQLIRVHSTQYDWPWQDVAGTLNRMKNRTLAYYKDRVAFHPPVENTIKIPIIDHFVPPRVPSIAVMNTEEIATLWHFPGRSVETPSIDRIETKTSKPPANLPF